MQPDDRDAAYLWDMRDAAQALMRIQQRVTYEDFMAERSLERMAIERSIEVIGEAARRVSEAFKAAHLEVPWSSIIAQRNAIAHEYDKIDYDEIWRSVTESLPELIEKLDALIPTPPQDTSE